MYSVNTAERALSLSPIFIVGAARSGTTLMASILGRHEQVFTVGETQFFEDIWTRKRELGELKSEAEVSAAVDRLLTLFGRYNWQEAQKLVDVVVDREILIRDTLGLGGGYGSLYYAFTSALARSAQKSYFCDDTPKHLYYLPTIFSLFPNAKVIACLRDPRDFLCSYKNYWHRSLESARIKAIYHPILTSLLWRSTSNLIYEYSQQFSNNRLIIVHYERLVTNPEEEVKRICNILGFDYSSNLIKVNSNNSSFENTASEIFSTSIARWRSCLTKEEIWWIQTLSKKNLSRFGYEIEAVRPSRIRLMFNLANTLLALPRALYANRYRRGPLVRYLARRVLTLMGG